MKMAGATGTKSPRVYLRGLTTESQTLRESRARQREAQRVVRAGTVVRPGGGEQDTKTSKTTWLLTEDQDPFLSQTLQVHYVELAPGGNNPGHGHQNEAAFYILEGRGYEVHDGQRYDWEKDDVAFVHADCVHQHFNADPNKRALALVIKAKAAWMYLGLTQQGLRGTRPADDERYEPRSEWMHLWEPGTLEKKKVVKPTDTSWEITPDGKIRVLTSRSRADQRLHSVDMYQQEIAPGSRSGRHWHMADEVMYVMAGTGESKHWDVEVEIDDRYYARVAREPSTWRLATGDLLYIPQNTVHQHFNDSGTEPLILLSGKNRLFQHLGYASAAYLEDAPEYRAGSSGRRSQT